MIFAGAEKTSTGKGYNLFFYEAVSNGYGIKPHQKRVFNATLKVPSFVNYYVTCEEHDNFALSKDFINQSCDLIFDERGRLSDIQFAKKA